MLGPTDCDVDIEYDYNITNTAMDGPLFRTTTGKGKKGSVVDDDGTVFDVTFLSEVFKSSSGMVAPTRRALLCPVNDTLFTLPEDLEISPGETVTVTSVRFSVDVCSCTDLTFGAAIYATTDDDTDNGSMTGKGKGKSQPVTTTSSCSVADVSKISFATTTPPTSSPVPSSVPSTVPSEVASGFPSQSQAPSPCDCSSLDECCDCGNCPSRRQDGESDDDVRRRLCRRLDGDGFDDFERRLNSPSCCVDCFGG